ESSRASNLAQLSGFIQAHSAGNAVIVMGDTNTRYTRAADNIAGFASANGLTDAWVQLVRHGSAPAPGAPALVCDEQNVTNDCEVVDKVLYRGNNLVSLSATYYNNEHAKFLDDAGRMLSDHDPVTVRFNWTRNPALRLSDQFGGPHGDYFTDVPTVPAAAQVRTLSLRSGSRVDQVGVTLADGTTLAHGGSGGNPASLTLGSNEYITSATLCQGKYKGNTRVFSARFVTNLGRTLAGGSDTSDCVTRTAPDGWQIAGFHGRSGGELDKVGFLYTKR
ncbi:MAG TPA: jacalin-like lectin, partial [Kutzneria sp.]